jgi:hypothetical protein
MTNNKAGIGHNQKKDQVSDESIKETVKKVIIDSFKSWETNKL